MRRSIPARRTIDRFIEYNRRPFTVKDIVNDTGIHPKTVSNLLPQFVRNGRIRVLLRDKNGTIYGKVPKIDGSSSGKQYDWKPNEETLKKAYDLVGRNGNTKVVARNLGLSHETTCRYLRILRLEGCITRKSTRYNYEQVRYAPTIRWFSEYVEMEKRERKKAMLRARQLWLEKEKGKPKPHYLKLDWF